MLRHLLPAILLLMTSVSAAQADEAAIAAGKAAFSACKACHAVEKGKTSMGPSLYGVVGRKAGTVPGFAYSKAMASSGITWDNATLDAFITAPQVKVPGTRMPYAGLKDAARRLAVITYLKTLHD